MSQCHWEGATVLPWCPQKGKKMLRDELEELKEHPEGLNTQIGACIFCGQMAQIETLSPWPEEKCNEVATELCDCAEAKTYVYKKRRLEKACRSIEEQFRSQEKTIRDILRQLAALIVDSRLESATVKINGELKAKISLTAKGSVKVERIQTKKTAEEV